ncbi:hypothetical protein [Methanocella sp. MCL-LM]|uniref:hypothetical protein n=1 Tax=Methanocella sp. MCL-LM TaxID=3412035 RepID=UPI003C788BDA
MKNVIDWRWKICEAIERLQRDYDYIGRNTGAPFLSIIYPHEDEIQVYKEWNALTEVLIKYDVKTIDVLDITMSVVDEIGVSTIVDMIINPMPGSNPENDLANEWVSLIVKTVRENATSQGDKKPIIVIKNLAALYPVTGPHTIMQKLWDTEQSSLNCPVVLLIPGTLKEPRVYSFVNKREEFMYRGDAL